MSIYHKLLINFRIVQKIVYRNILIGIHLSATDFFETSFQLNEFLKTLKKLGT